MSQNVAPWLQGLDEAWETPQGVHSQTQVSSSSHNANIWSHNDLSRIPRRSTSGLASSQRDSFRTSKGNRRSPLATISHNDGDTLRRQGGTIKLSGTRSLSSASDASVLLRGTVQQRAKSASPVKRQETLEWKKRLVHGQVGYGDQTDLFGPSGLDNIFAQSRKPSPPIQSKPRSSMSWLDRSAMSSMPSSPPPWPRQGGNLQDVDAMQDKAYQNEILTSVDETHESDHIGLEDENDNSRITLSDVSGPNQSSERLREVTSEYSSSPSASDSIARGTRSDTASQREASGKTELEQEDFSPVFVSKHTTMTGQVDYKALDSRMVKQLQEMHVTLRHPSHEKSDTHTVTANDTTYSLAKPLTPKHAASEEYPHTNAPDLSMSENLPTGTPPVASLGRHVELKRGGYSNHGSFKQRPLSSSQSVTAEDLTIEGYDDLLSPIPSTGWISSPALSPLYAVNSSSRSLRPIVRERSAGSPLKLFGPHDTFTNNKLLRRMSQLDPDLSVQTTQDTHTSTESLDTPARASRSGSRLSFGSGEYDDHGFNAQITVASASDLSMSASDRSPGSDIPPPGSKVPLGFRLDDLAHTTDGLSSTRKQSRHSAFHATTPLKEVVVRAHRCSGLVQEDALMHVTNVDDIAHEHGHITGAAKRPPNSPHKAPSSKRRRTLFAMEMDSANANSSSRNQPEGRGSSRKRKDARKGEDPNTADPEVLAHRRILRPRTPTPGQRLKEQIEAEIREATEEFAAQEPGKLEAVMEKIESSMISDSPPSIEQQAQAVANEVAQFTLRVQKASGEHTERKRSVTTQDFFNEAVMVMKLIRERAGRQSGLGSVAECDHEVMAASPLSGSSNIENSALRISRPPSREGGSGWRPRTSQQTDTRKISHLRKFEERDDTEFIAQSIASLGVAEPDEPQMLAMDQDSNIRIKGPLTAEVRLAHDETGTRPLSQRSGISTLDSIGSQPSNGTSTGRTIHTTSTRKSDNLGTLAPDAVAHLIGEQVGGMTFDREKQRWLRVRDSPPKRMSTSFLEPSNISSDDDPFREISDLPIDERKEEEIRIISSGQKPAPLAEPASMTGQPPTESRATSQETVVARPTSSGSSKSHHTHSSSIPSSNTALFSSQQQHIETRATSWSNEELEKLSAQGKANQQPLAQAAARVALTMQHETDKLAEQHIQSLDMAATSQYNQQPSVKTGVLGRQLLQSDVVGNDSESLGGLCEDTALGNHEPDVEALVSPKLRQAPQGASTLQASPIRERGRQVSLRRQTLSSKLNRAQAHEQSELSFVASLPGERMMSISLSVSRPLGTRQQPGQVTELQSSPPKFDPSFMLSDLPDFTVHEEDHERPSERALAQRLAKHAAAEVDDRYALAVKDLVKTLTDVQEEDLFWDDLKQLDLHDRSLVSLQGLSDFCCKVQEMDVSDNELTQLTGSPATLRSLYARGNQLSNLTAWHHLSNLQYLDISGNELDSLHGLGCLVHLRELRADDNQITTLDGTQQLDGLLKLRLRRNKIRNIHFEGSQMHRLVELDLCDNKIASVRHLDSLESLESLKLDGNLFGNLKHAAMKLPGLKHLSLQRCKLSELSVIGMPVLRTILLDDNALATVEGIGSLRMLETLSMRRQALPHGSCISILNQAIEARTIRLSGSHLPLLELQNSFLSLQHLELASVGLQELPGDFGIKCPNLRSLNLNFNSLRDIRPLLNIQNLEELSVCSNRLDRLRKSIQTLAKMTSLQCLDLRDNMLTQGFYAPHSFTMRTDVARRARKAQRDALEDEDLSREDAESAKYKSPVGDAELNRLHEERLNEELRMKRRVYALLLAHHCTGLKAVDGLTFTAGDAAKKDGVWDRLLELGIVRRTGAVAPGVGR